MIKPKNDAIILYGIRIYVTSLALDSQLKQRLARALAKREAQESHLMLLGV
jgi:hypothetical protein